MYAFLAVTCHLHFWQNDRDFLRATVVTRGWNGYRNKSQHRKSTLEKKILPPFQQGFEPATFQSRVRCSNHWAIPAPKTMGWTSLPVLWVIHPAKNSLARKRETNQCNTARLHQCNTARFSISATRLDSNSKRWFTTTFLQPLPYLVTPLGPENCQLTSSFVLVLAYAAQMKPESFESRRNSFFLTRGGGTCVYVRALALGCFHSHISTRTFRRALKASVDSCAEIKSAPSVA